ncbi:MAG TPA: ISNCY family transposase, partial [Geminicoccaceae bacterium]|nr:ISNCY family transposase [Geminicoccaceae bacterium]
RASALVGVSERTLRRWRQRYGDEGADGLVDRRVGRPSPKRAPADELERMRALYQQTYQGFTIEHFHEKLEKRHGYKLGDTTTRLYLHKTGTVQPAPRRGAHRRKRPRRPMRGMRLHQDGARHARLAEQPAPDLTITMDDATSEIYSAFLVDEEGTMSSFCGLVEVVERHGLFMAPYTDRGSHYFHTPEAGGKVSETQLTQVGRALKQRGIGHIPAYSPEARGRCERASRTSQDRPPKALAPARITSIEAANRFPRGGHPAEHNARFAVPAEEPASAFVAVPEPLWRDVLCIQEERRVGDDNCVRGHGRSLQIPPTPLRPHLVRATPRPGACLSRRHARHLQGPAPPGQPPASGAGEPRGTGRVTTATRPAPWPWWTTPCVAHNPTGPTTAVNPCATCCGHNNALATHTSGSVGPVARLIPADRAGSRCKPGLSNAKGYRIAEDFDAPPPDDLLDLCEGKGNG